MWGGIVLGGMAVLVACAYFPWAPMFGYFFETVEALGVWGCVTPHAATLTPNIADEVR